MADKNEKKVGHVYQIVYDLGNGRQFSVNGNFAEGSTEQDMFDEACKCLNVADRIRARSEIELLSSELETRKEYLERAKEDLRRILDKPRKSPTDENQITSLKASIEKIESDVKKGEQNLTIAKSKAGITQVMPASNTLN